MEEVKFASSGLRVAHDIIRQVEVSLEERAIEVCKRDDRVLVTAADFEKAWDELSKELAL